jgi:peptide/nickel transport system substrate-binding protein
VPYAGVPFSDVARLRQNPDRVFEPKGYSYNAQIYFVECNLRRPYLSDVRVRQAIADAIDKQGLVKTVWYDVSQPVDGPIPPSLTRYYTKDKPDYPFDPAKAEKLLDEAGYPRQANGVRFSITLDLSPSADAFVSAGDYIRQNLKKIGIEIRPTSSDVLTYLRKVYTNYDFDLTLQGYSALLDPEIGLTRIFWSKGASPGVPYVNASGYASPTTDKIIESYQRELDGEKRVALFHDFQRVVMTDLPLIPIMDAPFFTFYNRRVHGLDLNPDGARSSFKNVWLTH